MAHIIVVAEGFAEGLKKFEENFNGRVYANGKSKVRVREIKLLHFGFNDKDNAYEEILADIKSIVRYNEADNKTAQKDTTTELHSKFQKYIKYFRKFFKGIKSIDEDLDKVEVSSFNDDMRKKGIVFNTALIPIGRINDYKNLETGEELVWLNNF